MALQIEFPSKKMKIFNALTGLQTEEILESLDMCFDEAQKLSTLSQETSLLQNSVVEIEQVWKSSDIV